MEYLDIVDEQGQPTGEIISRTLAHTKGIRHRTAHIWIVRRENEHFQVLMQKRAMSKDSFPGKPARVKTKILQKQERHKIL